MLGKRLIGWLVFTVVSVFAGARDDWYETPLATPAGMVVIDTLDAVVDRAMLQVRAELQPNARSRRMSLCWGDVRATLELPDRSDDPLYIPEAIVRIDDIAGDSLREISRYRVPMSADAESGFLSLKVVADRVSARLYVGGSEQQFVASVPFDRNGGQVAAVFSHPAKVRRLTAEAQYRPAPEYAPFASVVGLMEYLAASTDINEAVWDYLDRDVDSSLASVGGRYRLATVKSATCPGGYDIIYLGGADSDEWKPLRIRGRLLPSIFIDSYGLDWIDGTGRLFTGDQDAQITESHSILTLRWPLYRSQLRFSRASD